MTLWDAEVGRFEDDLLKCPVGSLRTLGLRVIEETPKVYVRPLEELFDQDTVALFRNAVGEFRSFAGCAETVSETWGQLFAEACDWQDSKSPFTAASLCQGLAQYSDFLLGEDNSEELLEVLSSCYESVLSVAALGRTFTVNAEQEDPRCRQAVGLQLAQLEEVCGIS
ncbi:hypothetical protein [Streptomyces sp. YIM S03343]